MSTTEGPAGPRGPFDGSGGIEPIDDEPFSAGEGGDDGPWDDVASKHLSRAVSSLWVDHLGACSPLAGVSAGQGHGALPDNNDSVNLPDRLTVDGLAQEIAESLVAELLDGTRDDLHIARLTRQLDTMVPGARTVIAEVAGLLRAVP